jgi:predicted Holliday junction resolvase-like endonuclease
MTNILLLIALVGFIVYSIKLYRKAELAENNYSASVQDYTKLLSQKKSSEVKTGHIAEKLAPFLSNFPKHSKTADIVPMFMPIDYMIFDTDVIKFLEVKSGDARLSKKQRHYRDLVKAGKVEWHEMRIK